MKLLQANSWARFRISSGFRQLINDLEHQEGSGRSLHTRARAHGTTGTTGSHATGIDGGQSHTGGSPMHAWSTALPSTLPVPTSSQPPSTRHQYHSRQPSISHNDDPDGTPIPSTSTVTYAASGAASSHTKIIVAPMIGSLAFGASSAQVSASSLLPSSRVMKTTLTVAATIGVGSSSPRVSARVAVAETNYRPGNTEVTPQPIPVNDGTADSVSGATLNTPETTL
jgi:hypothetical protein